MKLNVSGF